MFSKYSVTVVPHAAVFLMYLCRERCCPHLYSSTIFNPSLSIFMITILISLLCRLLIFTFLNSWVFSCSFIWDTLLCHIISPNSALFVCFTEVGYFPYLGEVPFLGNILWGPAVCFPHQSYMIQGCPMCGLHVLFCCGRTKYYGWSGRLGLSLASWYRGPDHCSSCQLLVGKCEP